MFCLTTPIENIDVVVVVVSNKCFFFFPFFFFFFFLFLSSYVPFCYMYFPKARTAHTMTSAVLSWGTGWGKGNVREWIYCGGATQTCVYIYIYMSIFQHNRLKLRLILKSEIFYV